MSNVYASSIYWLYAFIFRNDFYTHIIVLTPTFIIFKEATTLGAPSTTGPPSISTTAPTESTTTTGKKNVQIFKCMHHSKI